MAQAQAADFGIQSRIERGEVRVEGLGHEIGRDGKPIVPLDPEGRRVIRAKVKNECKLDWYVARGLINDEQREIGLTFRGLFETAAASTHVTGSYGQRITGQRDFSEAQITARNRLRRAYMALGQDYTGVLIRVCGMDEWASGDLPALRLALDGLGDHWGMPREVG